MTVRELIEQLSGLNPQTLVVVETDGWYRHLDADKTHRPEEAEKGSDGYAALTFTMGDSLDTNDGNLYVTQPSGEGRFFLNR